MLESLQLGDEVCWWQIFNIDDGFGYFDLFKGNGFKHVKYNTKI